ncbi:CDP-glycerol glycerophosphotransferase [Oceanobacillus limi]|uniref:CDP-glycerol glycerophosphotransferase n=1 Tax=Oceanobacillus limi TaxID=930131 RepID=A0A1I0A3B3_9BACI|nr:CDP-glycerol glycerophosphotransferase family protein [Oceanobacillus limi]SES88632.1 CDP-glycerol glycerophosphotransferase [Oceanobacillus limi]
MLSFFKRKKKRPKPKLKHQLKIEQSKQALSIQGMLSKEEYLVSELWLFPRKSLDGFLIDSTQPSNSFVFHAPLDKLMEKFRSNEELIYDWYFKVTVPYDMLSEVKKKDKNVKLIDQGDELVAEYFMRLGKFQYSEINIPTFYHEQEDTLINYVTKKGNLSLVYNDEPNTPTKLQIDGFKRRKGLLQLEGKIFTRNSKILSSELVLKGRDTLVEFTSTKTEFTHQGDIVEKKYGLNRYLYKAEIDLATASNGRVLEEDVYDLYFKLVMHDMREPKYVRIGRPTFKAKFFLNDLYAKDNKEAAVIRPYYTFKKRNLSLEVYTFPVETYNYLRRIMRWAWLIRLLNKNKNVWLVGERVYKAQDTGLAFFKYLRTQHPDKNVYYVIDKNSPEKKNVEKYGNVLDFKSKQHILNTIIAKKIISSHHPDYIYPIRTNIFKSKIKADKIFLQHGVMGTKNMVANYGKNAPDFDVDFFLVSSEFEKDIIINDFDYHPDNVFVTGLSRFDTLFANDVPLKKQVLIIPTWRDWIVTDEAFIESEYYDRYKELINSERFHKLATEHGFEILFCLHPNMQKFSRYFENDFVKVISQGEVDVQHLLKESALMITDYSSVGFDFSFLYKPVIYYQFDRERFIGKRPSHLDLDQDLPGEIGFEQEEILDLVQKYATNEFAMKEEYRKRADKFIAHRDRNSSERIFQVVVNNEEKHPIIANPKYPMLKAGFYRKFRKSKLYYPTIKAFYNIGRRVIPVDPKLILFESGLGKQYSDSPRMIYEEILHRNMDYKKVWVYNKKHRFSDPNTKRIKRLTPAYFYYLLRSKYWVNNQNFPTYIKKRPQTTYLQTWHGTPLKKMLFDLTEVHGRSDDYVNRVSNAVKNWDYLISPSRYATNAFKSAFQYNGKVLEIGYPRNDIFYNEERFEVIDSVKTQLGIPKEKKVILYAPTFRDYQTSKKNKFKLDLQLDLEKLQAELGEEYVLVLRMHSLISNKISIDEELECFVINASNYGDIQELYLVTDILITDYSSVMFDFANTKNPMLFYTYDFELYRDNIRGFYMDFEEEAPGPLVFDTDEIIEKVKTINQVEVDYEQKYRAFREKYCSLEDGFASKRVVDAVFTESKK